MGKMDNKVAIVTGGGKGIGFGIATAFAKEGANLVIPEEPLSAYRAPRRNWKHTELPSFRSQQTAETKHRLKKLSDRPSKSSAKLMSLSTMHRSPSQEFC